VCLMSLAGGCSVRDDDVREGADEVSRGTGLAGAKTSRGGAAGRPATSRQGSRLTFTQFCIFTPSASGG